MGRLGWKLITPLALSLAAFACGDDGAAGGGTETETGTGTAGTTGDGSATNPTMTTMTTNSTQGMTGTTDPTGAPTTGVDSTGAPATDTGTPATDTGTPTGGAMACEMCIEMQCGDEIAACAADMDCACWIDCINMGNDQGMCFGMCGPPPMELPAIADCIDAECAEACAPGGTGTTGGNMGGGTYDMCMGDMDCPMDAPCNMFIGYCSVMCNGDDNNCPAPPDGDITPTCSNFSDQCILPCGNGGQCPTGMSCQQVGGGNNLCVFN